MSVRKRVLPSEKIAWLVCYRDREGKRRARQFDTRAKAVEFETRMRSDIAAGVHVADRASVTVSEAAKLWLTRAQRERLEAGTIRQYVQHVECHIAPLIGQSKVSRLTVPAVEKFRDELLAKCSRALARAVLTSFKGILKEARRQGLLAHDPAAHTSVKFQKADRRQRDIPTKEQIRAILKGADRWPYIQVQRSRNGEQKTIAICWRALVITAVFTGMRCSELRGLTWDHVDLAEGLIRVRQRADFQNQIGSTKSQAGDRDIPLSPMVLNTLRAWRLACPNWPRNLVFPTTKGSIHSNGNIHHYCWGPLLKELGIVKNTGTDAEGRPILKPALTLHSLRHAAASLFIEQGWNAKKIQKVMGHSSITVTFDTYGHLWKDTKSDLDDLAQMEARLLA